MNNNFKDTFSYMGETYKSGTILIINNRKLSLANVNATFLHNNNGMYRISYINTDTLYNTKKFIYLTERDFYNGIVRIVSEENTCRKKIIPKDKDIDVIIIGWMWYIFIMSVGIIFNARLFIWIISTLYFFKFRKRVKEENSYYAEW